MPSTSEVSTWSRSFDADQWGNSWGTANSGVTLASFTPVGSTNFDANNRLQIQGSNYDLAGNQTVIGGYSFAYDGENRLAQSTLSGASASYSYDGEGRRVKKVNGSRTVVYVYGVDGNLIQEYDTAVPADAGRQYLAQDMLGSTRVVFNSTGTAVRCMDYLPFGEQIPQGVGSGRSGACWAASEEPRQKFTGKEREGADGAYLDFFEARYLSGAQGRFTTPDWAEKPEAVPYASFDDPQSLNLYGYVRNNPINNRDMDGHICFFGFGSTCAKVPPPPPPKPPKANVSLALLRTDLRGRTTTFQTSTPIRLYSEVQIETRSDVSKKAKPGAADPYSTPGIIGVSNRHAGTDAYGPAGAFIDTNDPRGRAIHGGGTGLPDTQAPRQGWVPTLGCTRGQNEDVIRLGEAIATFQKEYPGIPIPYIRKYDDE